MSKININLKYDVTSRVHHDIRKEIEFSVEDFEDYISSLDEVNIEYLSTLFLDYMMERGLDEPDVKDSEQVDWDEFESSVDRKELLELCSHLIRP